MSFHNPDNPGNGEAAIEALIIETTAYNASRRYRLTSMPEVVVLLPVEAGGVLEHLEDRHSRITTDMAVLRASVQPVELPEPIYGD